MANYTLTLSVVLTSDVLTTQTVRIIENLKEIQNDLISGFEYAVPTSYLVDEFNTINTTQLIDAFGSIVTS